MTMLTQINYLFNENDRHIIMKIISATLLVLIFLLIVLSYKMPHMIWVIKYCLIIIQIRIYLNYGTSKELMSNLTEGGECDKTGDGLIQFNIVTSIWSISLLMMNHTMIEQVIHKRHALKHNSIELLFAITCTIKIVYGWDDFKEKYVIYFLNIIIVYLIAGTYHYFKDKLYKLNSNKTLHINNVIKEKEIFNELQNEYQQIFESLEEGIVVVKNDKMSFTNEMFHEIFRSQSLLKT